MFRFAVTRMADCVAQMSEGHDPDEISLVGSPERIKDRLQAWEESAVTMINVAPRTVEEVWQIAELVKG